MLDLRLLPIQQRTAVADRPDRPALRIGSTLTGRLLAGLACVLTLATTGAQAQWKAEIGYTDLQKRLGPSLPTGQSIQIAQVEMPLDEGSDYLPDRTDAQLSGKTINGRSGAGGISSHATIVGQYCMGLTSSIGPGIRLIDSYEANNWAGPGLLNVNTNRPPRIEERPVQNHSWIGSFGSECIDIDALRRIDWVVERDGVLVAAGVKNGAGTAVPHLMCSAYNVIAVGVSNGRSSYGPTRIDAAGRSKPDIVVPVSATSWATPVVASSASILLESIEQGASLNYLRPAEARAARPMLVKALLMGGATKAQWPDWRRGFDESTPEGSAPLDYRYGAGQLNIDRSYRILETGRQPASLERVSASGWDASRISPSASQRYYCDLESDVQEASILVAWHRRIEVTRDYPLTLGASLANIDVRLYRLADDGQELVDLSRSKVDNVEHIHLRDVASGRYMIELISDRTWDYAITWDFYTAPRVVEPPSVLVQAPPAPDAARGEVIRTVAANAVVADGQLAREDK